MSTAAQTPGDRACRYAVGAETVLRAFAEEERSDLAWGLHALAQQAFATLTCAIEAGDTDALEEASLRYCYANAIVSAIAQEAEKDLLFAGESLMESAKLMLDAEVSERLRRSRSARPQTS